MMKYLATLIAVLSILSASGQTYTTTQTGEIIDLVWPEPGNEWQYAMLNPPAENYGRLYANCRVTLNQPTWRKVQVWITNESVTAKNCKLTTWWGAPGGGTGLVYAEYDLADMIAAGGIRAQDTTSVFATLAQRQQSVAINISYLNSINPSWWPTGSGHLSWIGWGVQAPWLGSSWPVARICGYWSKNYTLTPPQGGWYIQYCKVALKP